MRISKKIFRALTLLLMIGMIVLIGISFWIYKHEELDIQVTQYRSLQFRTSWMNWAFPLCVLLVLFSCMKMMSSGTTIINWLSENPIRFSAACSIAFMLIIVYYSYIRGIYEDFNQILIEAHGIIFDVAVVGVLFELYGRYRNRKEAREKSDLEKKEAIKRYREEIDLIRDWHDEAARHKTVSIVNKLSELGIHSLNLSNCFLIKADFHQAVFEETYFNIAVLTKADLRKTTLNRCVFNKAKMEEAQLSGSKISASVFTECVLIDAAFIETVAAGCNFDSAVMNGAKLMKADFTGSFFRRAVFSEAVLRNAILSGADMRRADFARADLTEANLDGVKVDETDWFGKLEQTGVKGIAALTNLYDIDPAEMKDENGNTYFLVKRKESAS